MSQAGLELRTVLLPQPPHCFPSVFASHGLSSSSAFPESVFVNLSVCVPWFLLEKRPANEINALYPHELHPLGRRKGQQSFHDSGLI